MGSIEQGYVAKKITLHMDEIGWGLVGTSVDDDFFARKILLYLFAIDFLGGCVLRECP